MTILCYGDSNTWGYIPGTIRERYEPDVRWTGVAQKLLGSDYLLIEEGLNGRTTVYDNPCNLFVAKFLGTPPINVFSGEISGGRLLIGGEAVMPFDAADRAVDVAVRRLREKVEDNPAQPRYIITRRGAGYLFQKDA